MRLKEADEHVEVQSLDGSSSAPILQCVPRLGSAQDQRTAAPVLEVIGISGGSERPRKRRLPGILSLRRRGSAETSRCKTGESKIRVGTDALAIIAGKELPNSGIASFEGVVFHPRLFDSVVLHFDKVAYCRGLERIAVLQAI